MSFLIADTKLQEKIDTISRKFLDKFSNKKAVKATQFGKKSEHNLNTIILFSDGTLWSSQPISIKNCCMVVNKYWYGFFEGLAKLDLLTKEDLGKIKNQIEEYEKNKKEADVRRTIGQFVRKVGKNKAIQFIRDYNEDMELADRLYEKFIHEYVPQNPMKRYYFHSYEIKQYLTKNEKYHAMSAERKSEIIDYFERRIKNEHGTT